MYMNTTHTASAVDAHADDGNCRPPGEPFATDPTVWAKAFLFSGDWRDPARVADWFANAMRAVAPVESFDAVDDLTDYAKHARPPSA
jgi:hypothetical protein